MAEWSVKPTWKKSIIERQEWTKDGQTFIYETGWRWGEFIVYTDDDNPPDIEAGVDMYCCDYETELVETTDGCWDDYDYDDCDEETQQWLENFFEEGNSVFDLEEHGWYNGDTEMIINCDLEITRLDGDNAGETINTGSDEEVEESCEPCDDATCACNTVDVEAPAKWPFTRPQEGPKVVEEESPELTDWFPVSINPVRKGIYEILTVESINWPFPNKGEWTGKKWKFLDHTVTQWRGLAKDPGAK